MSLYKMLILNRLREYKRLIQNLFVPLLSLAVVICMAGYWIIKYLFPVISKVNVFNNKLYYFFIIVLELYAGYICFVKNKPYIIVKPASLFFLTESKVKTLMRIKLAAGMIKQLLFSLVIACCINGFHMNLYSAGTLAVLFGIINGGSLLSWRIYHNHIRFIDVVIWGIIALAAFFMPINIWLLIALIAVWFVLFIYDILFIKIDIEKYEDEMKFNEKLLTAQNFNNMVLLNQYAKEKRLRYLPKRKKESKLMQRTPIIWKAYISISRLSSELLIAGAVIFVICLAIYKIPFLWTIPLLDQEIVRRMLLIVGIFAMFQISVQSMLKQMDSLLQKQQEGLFIPLSDKQIIKQFTLIPILVIGIESVLLSAILQQNILPILLCGALMMILTIVIFTLNVRNKDMLTKAYSVFSLIMLVISAIMSWR